MTEKDFIELIVDERISMLVRQNKNLQGKKKKQNEILAEAVEENIKLKVEQCLELMLDEMAETEKTLYVGGVKDGIRIGRWVQAV